MFPPLSPTRDSITRSAADGGRALAVLVSAGRSVRLRRPLFRDARAGGDGGDPRALARELRCRKFRPRCSGRARSPGGPRTRCARSARRAPPPMHAAVLLPWTLMFRTHEQVLARLDRCHEDRDPVSRGAVDRAQATGASCTALVALPKDRARISGPDGEGMRASTTSDSLSSSSSGRAMLCSQLWDSLASRIRSVRLGKHSRDDAPVADRGLCAGCAVFAGIELFAARDSTGSAARRRASPRR